jgi:hypothetical protein
MAVFLQNGLITASRRWRRRGRRNERIQSFGCRGDFFKAWARCGNADDLISFDRSDEPPFDPFTGAVVDANIDESLLAEACRSTKDRGPFTLRKIGFACPACVAILSLDDKEELQLEGVLLFARLDDRYLNVLERLDRSYVAAPRRLIAIVGGAPTTDMSGAQGDVVTAQLVERFDLLAERHPWHQQEERQPFHLRRAIELPLVIVDHSLTLA